MSHSTLRVKIAKLSYELREDPDKERDPRLHYWVSQDVSTTAQSIALSPKGGLVDGFEFSLPTVEGDVDGVPLHERVQHANLNVDVFCKLFNRHGQSCKNQAGSAKIPFYELLDRSAAKRRYTLKVFSWGDPNAEGENRDQEVDNDKGWIEIQGPVEVSLDGYGSIPTLDASATAYSGKVAEEKKNIFMHYVGSAVVFCKRIGYRWDVVKDVNAYGFFLYLSESDFCRYVYQCRAGILPAAAYLGARLGGTKAEYFEKAARTVFARTGTNFDTFDWESDPRCAAMLAKVLTLASNYMAYVPGTNFRFANDFYLFLSDLIYLPSKSDRRRYLRRALESFDYARMRGGGDCEDLALEIVLEAAELASLSGDAGLSKNMRAMVALRMRYVFAMALGGVSAAEINDESVRRRIEDAIRQTPSSDYYSVWKKLGIEMGAHMCACFRKFRFLIICFQVERDDSSRAVASLVAPRKPDGGGRQEALSRSRSACSRSEDSGLGRNRFPASGPGGRRSCDAADRSVPEADRSDFSIHVLEHAQGILLPPRTASGLLPDLLHALHERIFARRRHGGQVRHVRRLHSAQGRKTEDRSGI